ncbi:hypothetical protein NDU88_004301 [Pleurodeles waltl]|uniref:Uncharacterized protein n=1 Tax=Pleurodeles waltl TaxID=8319 RepID=A0AAV7SII9_PLEWA|nr:hypothetical protein NDU88_004301 [Pleurodeles waltl]
MDTAITSLMTETKSMRLEIAGFQSRVTGVEHRMATMEDHVHTDLDKDQELLFFCSKLIDLEDMSRRDNICLFGFPEHAEGIDTCSFLCSVLPKFTGIVFEPPLEFQRAHRLGPKRKDETSKPCPIIACLLRHEQVRKLLSASRTHRPFKTAGSEIRITATSPRKPTNAGRGS